MEFELGHTVDLNNDFYKKYFDDDEVIGISVRRWKELFEKYGTIVKKAVYNGHLKEDVVKLHFAQYPTTDYTFPVKYLRKVD